jgi:probable rRNA maturation factor
VRHLISVSGIVRLGERLVILQKKVAGVNVQSLGRFVLRARKAAGLDGTVHVLVTSSVVMRSLNRRFRNKDKATDVLSFPSASSEGKGKSGFAGEIAISSDIATQNAVRFGHPAAQEIKVLALHGILHLAGYDHERDNGVMARKEEALRRSLRLPTALIERTQSTTPRNKASRTRRAKRTA